MHGSPGTGRAVQTVPATGGPVLSAQRTYPAVAAAVRDARVAVCEIAERAGATAEQLEAVRLGVSEAATNVVRHAYRDGTGEIRITTSLAGEQLTVLVVDDGCGPHVPSATPGLGWGLALLARCGEEFSLTERPVGGTEALIRFRVG